MIWAGREGASENTEAPREKHPEREQHPESSTQREAQRAAPREKHTAGLEGLECSS